MQPQTYRLANRTIRLKRLEGVPPPGPINHTLISAARRVEGDEVFVTGPGLTMTVLWAAEAGARVTTWAENYAEAQSLRMTCQANRIPLPKIILDADFTQLPIDAFDQAMLHFPRGRDRQRELLDLALALLRQDGRLVFAGAKNEGIRSALGEARERFGQAGIVVRKGGVHAGLARRPPGQFKRPRLAFEHNTIVVDDIPTDLVTCTGVFAPGRLDQGTANLIEGMRIRPETKVLDLGCGTGLAGLAAARRGGNVMWADVSARAIESTRRTLIANTVAKPKLYLCHGARAIEDHTVDVVITNPPFHRGHDVNYEVSQLFVREADRVLGPGGEIYLVANNFLPYPQWLREHFIDVKIVREDAQFRVYHGRKSSATSLGKG
jgi:16S rRNA (guanine1207-N2)-methyltransferase